MGVVTQLYNVRDAFGNETSIRAIPSHVNHYEFATASSQDITIPTGATYCVVGVNSTTVGYVLKLGTGAAIAGANVTDGSASAFRVASFAVPSGSTQVSIATDGAAKITLTWYKHQ